MLCCQLNRTASDAVAAAGDDGDGGDAVTPVAAVAAAVDDGDHGGGRDGARNGGSCRAERRMIDPLHRHHTSGQLDPCPLLK